MHKLQTNWYFKSGFYFSEPLFRNYLTETITKLSEFESYLPKMSKGRKQSSESNFGTLHDFIEVNNMPFPHVLLLLLNSISLDSLNKVE